MIRDTSPPKLFSGELRLGQAEKIVDESLRGVAEALPIGVSATAPADRRTARQVGEQWAGAGGSAGRSTTQRPVGLHGSRSPSRCSACSPDAWESAAVETHLAMIPHKENLDDVF